MEITPLQALVAKFASKSEIRQELACVRLDGKTALATDSFRMVEVTRIDDEAPEADAPVLVNAKQLAQAKITKEPGLLDGNSLMVGDTTICPLLMVDAEKYPDVKRIWEQSESRDYVEVRLNGKYLADIATALSKFNDFEKVILRVPTDGSFKPVAFRASGKGHSARAVLMPMTS